MTSDYEDKENFSPNILNLTSASQTEKIPAKVVKSLPTVAISGECYGISDRAAAPSVSSVLHVSDFHLVDKSKILQLLTSVQGSAKSMHFSSHRN